MKHRVLLCVVPATLLNALVLVILSKSGLLVWQIGNRESKCAAATDYVSQLQYLCTKTFTPPKELSSIEEMSIYLYDVKNKPISNIMVNCTGEYLTDLGKRKKEDLFFLDYSPSGGMTVNVPYGVPKGVLRDNMHLLSVPLVLIPWGIPFGATNDESEIGKKINRFVFLHNMFVAYLLTEKYFLDRPEYAYKKVGDLMYWRTTWDGLFLRYIDSKRCGRIMILAGEQLVGKVEEFVPPELIEKMPDEWPPPEQDQVTPPPPEPNSPPPPSPLPPTTPSATVSPP